MQDKDKYAHAEPALAPINLQDRKCQVIHFELSWDRSPKTHSATVTREEERRKQR